MDRQMNQTPTLPFDVCENRHRGNPESAAANRKVHASKMQSREKVFAYVDGCGYHGSTVDEISAAFGVPPNSVSGRCSELRLLGRLLKTNRRRPTRSGCMAAVLVSAR